MSSKKHDDVFLRRIIAVLVGAIVLEIIGAIVTVPVLNNKIENLEKLAKDNKKSIESLRKVNNRLIRIEVLMETVVVGNNKISENQAIFGAEQQRRGPKIDEAIRHVRNGKLHAEKRK